MRAVQGLNREIGVEMTKLKFLFAMLTFTTIFLAAVQSSETFSASYNCNNAKLAAEVVICQDAALGIQDEQMAEQYMTLRKVLSPSLRLQLGKAQRAFIKARNSCDDSVHCISRIYRLRKDELCKLGQINGYPCDVQWTNITVEDHPQLSNCHMDVCDWFVVKKKSIAKNNEGDLLELRYTMGQSIHYPNFSDEPGVLDQYPDKFSESIPINWSTKQSVGHVFCSKRLPAFMVHSEDGIDLEYTIIVLVDSYKTVHFNNIAGIYVYTCLRVEPYTRFDNGFIEKFGLQPLPDNLNIKLSKPTDILELSLKMAREAN